MNLKVVFAHQYCAINVWNIIAEKLMPCKVTLEVLQENTDFCIVAIPPTEETSNKVGKQYKAEQKIIRNSI